MRLNTFWYTIQQGFKNIGRNKMFSLASIATMSACIFVFGLFYMIVANFNNMVRVAEESVAVTVFFEPGISDARIEEIANDIISRPEISKCVYVSSEEAWDYVKENYFEGREDLAQAFQGDNPVANSEHFEIYLKDVSKQGELVAHLETLQGVRSVHQSEFVANLLTDFNRLVWIISAGIILILLGVAVFLIATTVSVGVHAREKEIGIMKLIGATDFLVRAPFVVEGMVIGLFGAAIPLGILYFLYGQSIAYVTERFSFIGTILVFLDVETLFHDMIPVSVALGVGLGFLGSIISIHKHLRK